MQAQRKVTVRVRIREKKGKGRNVLARCRANKGEKQPLLYEEEGSTRRFNRAPKKEGKGRSLLGVWPSVFFFFFLERQGSGRRSEKKPRFGRGGKKRGEAWLPSVSPLVQTFQITT